MHLDMVDEFEVRIFENGVIVDVGLNIVEDDEIGCGVYGAGYVIERAVAA